MNGSFRGRHFGAALVDLLEGQPDLLLKDQYWRPSGRQEPQVAVRLLPWKPTGQALESSKYFSTEKELFDNSVEADRVNNSTKAQGFGYIHKKITHKINGCG